MRIFTKQNAITAAVSVTSSLLLCCGGQGDSPKGIPVSDVMEYESCILDKKLSIQQVKDLEKQFGSQLMQRDSLEMQYERSGPCDTIPLLMTYEFKEASVASVEYEWSNLPGRKDEIETRGAILIRLLEKRMGDTARFVPDAQRAEREMSTRIFFQDAWYWDRTGSRNYSAEIHYDDSGRAGDSRLTLEIIFDDEFYSQ